jgi:tetratricopeptide (TPR) repeat protein
MQQLLHAALGVVLVIGASSAGAQEPETRAAGRTMTVSPAELFRFADAARTSGDYATAETAYRALAQNPDLDLRSEARFRLAMMLADKLDRHREAAVLLRQILDEQPDIARVRVELARMQLLMGNVSAAQREFRAAQAAGLPPEVEQLVRFYAQALGARKPAGGSLQVAFAPDTNINRATTSDTLETIIGDFELSEDAKATSGLGLSLRGQGYYRVRIGPEADILLRASGSGRIYGDSAFNDYIASFQAGPQFASGEDRVTVSGVISHRWFGGDPYTFGVGASLNVQHSLGKRGRLTVDATAIDTQDRRNSLRDAQRYSLAAGVDRAFSSRFGGGLRVDGHREVADDPGYSTARGGVSGYVFRELGQTTVVANLGYSHLEADRRLFLYPDRRVDDRFEASLSGTFRSLRVGSFAPLASIRFEDNNSTVGIYDYDRFAAELGITAAF